MFGCSQRFAPDPGEARGRQVDQLEPAGNATQGHALHRLGASRRGCDRRRQAEAGMDAKTVVMDAKTGENRQKGRQTQAFLGMAKTSNASRHVQGALIRSLSEHRVVSAAMLRPAGLAWPGLASLAFLSPG